MLSTTPLPPDDEIVIPFITVFFASFFAPKRDYDNPYIQYECYIHSFKLWGRVRLGYWVSYDK